MPDWAQWRGWRCARCGKGGALYSFSHKAILCAQCDHGGPKVQPEQQAAQPKARIVDDDLRNL